MRRRALPALVLAAAVLPGGCGQDDPGLIGEDRSQELVAAVDRIEAACSDEDPAAVRSAVSQAEARVNELPRRTDEGLRENMREWLNQIERRADRDCRADEPEETPAPTPTETPAPEPTETPTPEPTETPTSEPTETPTPEPPDDEGGAPAPDLPGADE